MTKKILILLSTLVLIFVLLYFSGVIKGYYYKTNHMIGEYQVYNYNYISPYKCKCIKHVPLYEENGLIYYVNYQYEVVGYYIKYNGKYYQLDYALEKNLITIEDIKNSKIPLKVG